MVIARARIACIPDKANDTSLRNLVPLVNIGSAPLQVSVIIYKSFILADLIDRDTAGFAVKKLCYLTIRSSHYRGARRRHDINGIVNSALRACVRK